MTHPTTPSALPALAGVLLAAGASRRFGAVKALHPVEGETLVARAARSLLAVCGGGATGRAVGCRRLQAAVCELP